MLISNKILVDIIFLLLKEEMSLHLSFQSTKHTTIGVHNIFKIMLMYSDTNQKYSLNEVVSVKRKKRNLCLVVMVYLMYFKTLKFS